MAIISFRRMKCLKFLILLSYFSGATLCIYKFYSTFFQQENNVNINNISKNSVFNHHQNKFRENMSVVGRNLFLSENFQSVPIRSFLIYHVDGKLTENRLIKQYENVIHDPFRFCSVNNCRVSFEPANFIQADAIIFSLHRIKGPPKGFKRENYQQRWVWLTDESPFHTFMVAEKKNLSRYNNYFNWSMSYRSNSDVPVPYGRTIPHVNIVKSSLELDVFSNKTKFVAVLGSNCGGRNGRWKYVKKLQEHVQVDIYGKCGTLKCPGHFNRDCPWLNSYMFYLGFENSNCQEYITEKVWWNAFEKKSIPVVMGAPKEDYKRLLPPYSFIHVDDFASAKEMAHYLKMLSKNKTEYNKYHSWRKHFKVVNEHGYFKSPNFHYCRLCEALNFNDPRPKVYKEMELFWSVKRDCNNKIYA